MNDINLKPGDKIIIKSKGRRKSQSYELVCDRDGIIEFLFIGTERVEDQDENNYY